MREIGAECLRRREEEEQEGGQQQERDERQLVVRRRLVRRSVTAGATRARGAESRDMVGLAIEHTMGGRATVGRR